MPTITLTISIEVPEGTTVDVKPEITSTPKTATMPTIMFSEEPEYPEWASADRRHWSAEEDNCAADPDLSNEDVAELVDRSVAAVAAYRLNHGYRIKSRTRIVDTSVARSMQRWTKSEIEYLMDKFDGSDETNKEIGEYLGRTPSAVKRKHGYEASKAE